MRTITIATSKRKSLAIKDALTVPASIWLDLEIDEQVQGYARLNVDTARKLVEALNTFIKEANYG